MIKDIACVYDTLPFTTRLSFEPLYRKIKKLLDDSDSPYLQMARPMFAALEAGKGLLEKFTTEEAVRADEDGLKLLMQFVFPAMRDDEIMCRAYRPFSSTFFYTTGKYRQVFGERGTYNELELSETGRFAKQDHYFENMMFAYSMLYSICYDVDHTPSEMVMKKHNAATGLDSYYLYDYSFSYVDVELNGVELVPEKVLSELITSRNLSELERSEQRDRSTGLEHTCILS